MTSLRPTDEHTLNDGTTLPLIGLGTYGLTGADGVTAMRHALDTGYRMLDTAVNYDNEAEVGRAVAGSGLDRDAMQIVTKVPGRHHRSAEQCVEDSLRRLGTDHVDLVLIHWPNPTQNEYEYAWDGLVAARERGLTRSIGVSNFHPHHLDRIIRSVGVTPSVNQVELHPSFAQDTMREAHAERGILTEAWSPLGKREARYDAPEVAGPAERHQVTPAQVILRWHLQRGVLPIPKSATPERQRANIDLFGFQLTDDEVAAISALSRPDGRLFGGDPDHHEED
ncbi:aldo/keto reductase [Kytococcus sedentarius]|uniref:aldo/keto reductase n=1 Tax=Kytococcus sedentarius TaxID=1276 RepID=UPI0035BC0BB2